MDAFRPVGWKSEGEGAAVFSYGFFSFNPGFFLWAGTQKIKKKHVYRFGSDDFPDFNLVIF